jgi:hypothetical protein
VTRKVDFDSVGTGIGGIVAGGGDVVGDATGGAVAGTMVGDGVAPAPPTMLLFAFGSFSFALVRKEKTTANDVLLTATNTSKIAAISMKERRLPTAELPPPLSLLSPSYSKSSP